MDQIKLRKLERIKAGSKPRVLDLFAGAGGLSLGFLTAGLEIKLAVEFDAHAARTHAENFFRDLAEDERRIHSEPHNIKDIEPDQLLLKAGYQETAETIDVIIGGPPCQAFARVGRAKLREVAAHPEAFLQDPRANLYLAFLNYVKQLKPLIILMENVPDALNYGGHNIAEETCEVLSQPEMGYKCSYTLLNSAYYGVPQMRERMFLLAYAEELSTSVQFPKPTRWVELPKGYRGSRNVALKHLNIVEGQRLLFNESFYSSRPVPSSKLPAAVTAFEALSDLPAIDARELLKKGELRRGVQEPMERFQYPDLDQISEFASLMRNWPGFEVDDHGTGHIIRYLPRDFKLFAALRPGDQYPQAHRTAIRLFEEELKKRIDSGEKIIEGSQEYLRLYRQFVPPYDPGKFPNKWRKMEADQPARTLMAHIGKDSYSHIHYDSDQARTISVREAARLQSFPDGFQFSGKMNSAFRQIGNAVPPLLAYHLATCVMNALGQKELPLMERTA